MRPVMRHSSWLVLLVLALVVPLGADAQQAEGDVDLERFMDEQIVAILDHAIEASDRLSSCLEGTSAACTPGFLQLGVAAGRAGALADCCSSVWPEAAEERQLLERLNAAVDHVQRPSGSLSRLPPQQALPLQAELIGFEVQMETLLEEIQEGGGGS